MATVATEVKSRFTLEDAGDYLHTLVGLLSASTYHVSSVDGKVYLSSIGNQRHQLAMRGYIGIDFYSKSLSFTTTGSAEKLFAKNNTLGPCLLEENNCLHLKHGLFLDESIAELLKKKGPLLKADMLQCVLIGILYGLNLVETRGYRDTAVDFLSEIAFPKGNSALQSNPFSMSFISKPEDLVQVHYEGLFSQNTCFFERQSPMLAGNAVPCFSAINRLLRLQPSRTAGMKITLLATWYAASVHAGAMSIERVVV